jgi:hypothetical protein
MVNGDIVGCEKSVEDVKMRDAFGCVEFFGSLY